MDRELMTIANIARRLGLPESTVRSYRDRFAAYVPTVGEGAQRILHMLTGGGCPP